MLEVIIKQKRSAVLLWLSGELDCAEEGPCKEALEAAPKEAGRRFIIDLSGITFMDSTGIKLLLLADQSARLQGRRRPLIRGASARLMRVLDTAGVSPLLHIEKKSSRRPLKPGSAEHPSTWRRHPLTD